MNQHLSPSPYFSASRFGRLLVLHWADNRKRYLLAFPAMVGLLAIWQGFLISMNAYDPLNENLQVITYYTGLILVGCLFGSTIFAQFGHKAQGIAWLAIPASALEKLLCGWLFALVLFFLLYNLVFYIVDIPMVGIANQLIEKQHRMWSPGYPIPPDTVYYIFGKSSNDSEHDPFHGLLMLYFALQSAFILGSIYFERFAFIKTAIAVAIFIAVFMVVETRIVDPALPKGWERHPVLDWMTSPDTIRIRVVRISPYISTPLGYLLLYGTPLMFWITTYFRLKEKQV